jgi:hypothetical protein
MPDATPCDKISVIEQLSTEILLHVAGCLPTIDIRPVTHVSRQLYSVAKHLMYEHVAQGPGGCIMPVSLLSRSIEPSTAPHLKDS